MPEVQLALLGGFRILSREGTEVPLRSKSQRGLLAYLALNADRRVSRTELTNLLWSERYEPQARQSLRQALLALRRFFGVLSVEALVTDDDNVSMSGPRLHVDVREFERLSRERRLESAAAIYNGELLEGLDLRSDNFERWLLQERTRLRNMACEIWDALGQQHLQQGDAASAIEAAKRAIALDPLREYSHQLLMFALGETGQRIEALQIYQNYAVALDGTFGTGPSPRMSRLFEAIRDARTLSLGDLVALSPTPEAPAGSSVSPTLDKPSIGVLPFFNISDSAEQEHIADAFTEDVITGLAKSRSVAVIDRNSSFEYKGRAMHVSVIGRNLGVRYVVEGSVRKAGKQVRVTAQLVDTITGTHLWAERYDREREGIFKGDLAIQDDVTQSIVAAVVTAINRFHLKSESS